MIAIVSSSLRGTAVAITRHLVGGADPLTLAILRWGIGFLCVMPVALALRVRWPKRRDWPAIAALGVSFFGLFFVFYNIALGYTTAVRASLALSTLPLQTMLVGALIGGEALTLRRSVAVAIAVLGVFAALASGLAAAPDGAWRGELIMTAAVVCMAFYDVLSRPFMQRSSALGFVAVGMGFGAATLVLGGIATDRISVLRGFGTAQWIAGAYLGIGGGSLAFILGVLAPERAMPDARGQHDDRQSIGGGAARHAAHRRTDHAQSRRRYGVSRHPDRDQRGRTPFSARAMSRPVVTRTIGGFRTICFLGTDGGPNTAPGEITIPENWSSA